MGKCFIPICELCGDYIYSAKSGKRSRRCRKCQLTFIDSNQRFYKKYVYKNKNRVKL